MTTKKNLVKQVLMSTLTAGIFATAFTACSDEILVDQSYGLNRTAVLDGGHLLTLSGGVVLC